MTAQVIQFQRKETGEFVAMPEDFEDLIPLLSHAFIENGELLGYPEVIDYAEYIYAYVHPTYRSRLLLDVAVPNHANGTFCIENGTFKLVKMLDRPLVHFQ